ncbi:MAG: hypothetical protein LUD02_04040 [Tannerellaceae bacterium]|nr:hypothetical protein [Tannerellaceae bacterium]
MYDNGLDICGYLWETGALLTGLAILNTIQFSGRNIICRAASAPQVGTWTDGDIVFNTGSGTNSLWIRVNGNFIAK